ncbi:hypothetical protein J2X46_003186 [Nocardioides sp. BE266]|uniref:hypothetical protein n=1 Tax=Nocardioides sp. BE266 TaxID=2817725 RepID=UPI002858051C|nr:hypothetical protein [Nocardioides sp. BE266]MDR7254193.1 hypothetical protein [Nocardioides sp. BE266]
MTKQTMRQVARRDARSIAARRRAEMLERSRRLEELAVQVMSAIGERDLLSAVAERKAGEALRQMTAAEGLTIREAVEWCGSSVSLREATRLWKLAEISAHASQSSVNPSSRAETTEQP